jgi:hypothetical protein
LPSLSSVALLFAEHASDGNEIFKLFHAGSPEGHCKVDLSNEQVCVLVARDRIGQTLEWITGHGQITKVQLADGLQPVLATDVLLISVGNPTYSVQCSKSLVRKVPLEKMISVLKRMPLLHHTCCYSFSKPA